MYYVLYINYWKKKISGSKTCFLHNYVDDCINKISIIIIQIFKMVIIFLCRKILNNININSLQFSRLLNNNDIKLHIFLIIL